MAFDPFGTMNQFYTPNWADLFGPTVQRANNQAAISRDAAANPQFGLGSWFQNLFRRQMPGSVASNVGMALGIIPQQQQTVYGTPANAPMRDGRMSAAVGPQNQLQKAMTFRQAIMPQMDAPDAYVRKPGLMR